MPSNQTSIESGLYNSSLVGSYTPSGVVDNSPVRRRSPRTGVPAGRTSNAGSFWQVVLLPPRFEEEAESSGARPLWIRHDQASDIPAPIRALNWSTDVASYEDSPAKVTPEQDVDFKELVAAQTGAKRTANDLPSDKLQARLINLLSEAAHDIRSPIATASQIISTVTNRVRSHGTLTRGELELLDIANMRLVQASNWAEGILLDRSLEQGAPVVVRSRFYPPQWQEMVRPLLDSIAEQRQVQLNWVGWDRSLPRLYLDANHLSRAVLNLVTNAIQASRKGQEVSIRIDWQRNVSQRLVIAIEDSGCGLGNELLRQVNTIATWQNNTSPTNATGLGLKTAKSLILGLGGSISAQTAPSGGTLFRLTLPVDNPLSLVRGWLTQNAALATREEKELSRSAMIHAIRVRDLEPQLVDAHLQQAASQQDLVYRVAADRWLWMTIAAESHSGIETVTRQLDDLSSTDQACLTRLVFRSRAFTLLGLHSSEDALERLPYFSNEIAGRVNELLSGRVPPVDELQTRDKAIMVKPLLKRPSRRLLRADTASTSRPHLHAAKLRNAAKSGDPELTKALADLAEQWHSTQTKLEDTTKSRIDQPAASGWSKPIGLNTDAASRASKREGPDSGDPSGSDRQPA